MGRTIVAVVSDAYGGRGGIATYNRAFLKALCSYADVDEVFALPRVISYELEPMPSSLRFETSSAGSKLRYAAAVAALALRLRSVSLVTCGHLHLLPFAQLLGERFRCPVIPVIYGREAWKPTNHVVANFLCRRLKSFITIRKLTGDLLMEWAHIPNARSYYLPNCVDIAAFGVGPKRLDLQKKYGLENRTVVMTAARLDETDRNKGIDEVLATLLLLLQSVPDIVYLIMGDGNDTPRLKEKARELGVADRVAFTGYVPESEKVDHYRLADVVAMPGSAPDFDRYPFRFAFLEPLACGVPVVGSMLEDANERNDPAAKQLLLQVNPNDPADIKRGIVEALARRGRGIEPALQKFSFEVFEQSMHDILSDFFSRR